MKMSTIASTMALPREGHLSVLFEMFSFLKSKHNGATVFDPTEPEIDQTQFPNEDWSATPYGLCKEDVHLNSTSPRVTCSTIRTFCRFWICWRLYCSSF